MRRASLRVGLGFAGALAIGMALVVPRVAHAQARQADVVTLADLPPEAVRQIQAVWAIKARRTAVQQKIGSQRLQ